MSMFLYCSHCEGVATQRCNSCGKCWCSGCTKCDCGQGALVENLEMPDPIEFDYEKLEKRVASMTVIPVYPTIAQREYIPIPIDQPCCANCKHVLYTTGKSIHTGHRGTCGKDDPDRCDEPFIVKGTDTCEDFEKRPSIKMCLTCKYYKNQPSKPISEGGYEIRGLCMHPIELQSPDGQNGVGVAALDCCKKFEEKPDEAR